MSYFLQANAFLLFFYALYYLLLRRETFFRWNRGYLLVSIGLSLVIPMLKMPEFLQRNTQNIPIPAPIEQIIIAPLPTEEPTNTLTKKETKPTGWGLWEGIIIAYCLVVLVLLLRFLVSLVWLFRLGKGATWVQEGHYYLARLPESKESFSFFRTLFLGNTNNLTDTQIAQIIQHELAHIRQKHSWDIVLLELVIIAFWINPIGQSYKKSIRKVHEYLADREALAYQNDKTEYANLILKQSKKL
jgi:hypothetical protein